MKNLHRSEFFSTAGSVVQPETNNQKKCSLFYETGNYNSSQPFENDLPGEFVGGIRRWSFVVGHWPKPTGAGASPPRNEMLFCDPRDSLSSLCGQGFLTRLTQGSWGEVREDTAVRCLPKLGSD
jgi:hypothetical protein